jgi:hypothetical protein
MSARSRGSSTRPMVRVTTPALREVWDELVAANASTLPSQTPAWLEAACAHGHWSDASRLYELQDGRSLVLPLVQRRRVPHALAARHSMPPTWGTGGLLVATAVTAGDVDAVVHDLRSTSALRTTVRPDFEQQPLWDVAARSAGGQVLPAVHHVLDLHGDFGRTWAGFSKRTRTAVRKAERRGVTVEPCHGEAAVREFYRLYEGWLAHRARQRGIPLVVALRMGRSNEPLPRLLALSEALGTSFTVWLAELEGRTVAAKITLTQGRVALAWRATSDRPVAGPVRANDLLHRHAIEQATALGCRYYDMGESGGIESLMRYKTRFGATPRSFPAYRFERLPVSAVTGPAAELRHRLEAAALRGASRLRSAADPGDDGKA